MGINTEAEQALASYKAKAIGPTGSAVIVGGGPIFKADFTEGMLFVLQRASRGEDLDTLSQWSVILTEELHLALDIKWEKDISCSLLFHLKKWQVELDLFVTSSDNFLLLAPSGPIDFMKVLAVDAPKDIPRSALLGEWSKTSGS